MSRRRMSERPSGADYVALRRLSDLSNRTLAAVGETCERVPAEALVGLEARGAVQRRASIVLETSLLEEEG